ncbi:unnamed protein product [Fusarium graminearum]|uniref:Histidine-specific methyltransferase SAM-dependent domain-containing protein n=1 Tax=Gibberella zeae TaxID=5518 RepID=A0A9N8WWV8_GIBZA|nr:unnamed protein product [Fusarium graminearum]
MVKTERQLTPEPAPCVDDSTTGQVRDIGGGAISQCIKNELNESISLGKYLGKEVCYIDSPWPGGETSDQSLGERRILSEEASELAQQFYPLSDLTIFDLGSGDSEKLLPLLDELERLEKRCHYMAVDVNRASLESHVQKLTERYMHIKCSGLYGSFEDARKVAMNMPGMKIGISCSSTLTNFKPAKVCQILQSCNQVMDQFILGQHEPVDDEALEKSYHTDQFIAFMKNGWYEANNILGRKEFDDRRWTLQCKTTGSPQCHMFRVIPSHDNSQASAFDWFACYKYTLSEFKDTIQKAGWKVLKCYRDKCIRMSNKASAGPPKDSKLWKSWE